MHIIKHNAGATANSNPTGFGWFNNRFSDGFFLNLLNHIFPLSLFIAQKYNLSSKILVNRSITFLYNHAIEESRGRLVKELKRWFVVLQNSNELEPIDQYYLYILKRYSHTYSLKQRNMEDELINNTIPIASIGAERNTFFQMKKGKCQYERNINVFRLADGQLEYQPQSVIDKSANHYFNSFAVYEVANNLVLEYLEYMQNIASIIERSKDVADLVLLNSSLKIYAEGNRLSKDRYVSRMCNFTKRPFAINF
jgi:hypothetical protein